MCLLHQMQTKTISNYLILNIRATKISSDVSRQNVSLLLSTFNCSFYKKCKSMLLRVYRAQVNTNIQTTSVWTQKVHYIVISVYCLWITAKPWHWNAPHTTHRFTEHTRTTSHRKLANHTATATRKSYVNNNILVHLCKQVA